MTTNGQRPADAPDRRTTVLIALGVVVALLVFGGGYLLGRGGDEQAAPSPTATSPTPTPEPTPSREDPSPTPSEPDDVLEDGRYFVQITDVQGGDEGPLSLQYDLAYFYTGDDANQVAAARGDETPVPNDSYIVNDNPKLRSTPLAGNFVVRYLPEGSGLSEPVKATEEQFLGWMGQTLQTDFPPKDITWWWITIEGGEVTQIEQQYQP